jgi:hypothetical protein
MTVKLTEQFLGIAFVRRRVAATLFRFLDFSMLCRQEKFPSRYFRSVASVDGDAADRGTRPGASVGRRVAAGGRDSFRVSRFINGLQAGKFPSRYFRSAASVAGHAGGFGTRRFCSSERAVGPNTRCSGLEASETIPFSGPDSIFSSRCGAISRQVRPSLTMAVSERGALLLSGGELRTARSRNGDRARPSARSSWG